MKQYEWTRDGMASVEIGEYIRIADEPDSEVSIPAIKDQLLIRILKAMRLAQGHELLALAQAVKTLE